MTGPSRAPERGAPTSALTAIIAPMAEEVAPLRARLSDLRRGPDAGDGAGEVVIGRLNGVPVALAVTGDGARHAREGIAALLAQVRVDRLIAVGVAGGLSGDLAEGDLVVAEQVAAEDAGGFAPVRADELLVEGAVRASGARRAVVMTAERIADTPAEKRRLFGLAIGAASGAGPARGAASALSAVVDLESAGYVAAAARAGIPWLVLRAVSDTAGESLPSLLNRSRDEGGGVRRGRVMRGLLADPSVLPVLLGLRRRVQRCAGVLDRAVAALLAAPLPTRAASSSNEGTNPRGEGRGPATGSPGGM